MTRPLYQSDQSYRRTLKELKSRVEAGVKLEYYDCEEIGAENTECTLGLCDDRIKEMQDGIYRGKGHGCPHDERFFTVEGEPIATVPISPTGCFFYCNIFQGSKRERCLAQQRILTVVGNIGKSAS
jgi:hypothetical protein